jgi:hypothetical protein
MYEEPHERNRAPESESPRPHSTRRPTEQQKPDSRQPQASLSASQCFSIPDSSLAQSEKGSENGLCEKIQRLGDSHAVHTCDSCAAKLNISMGRPCLQSCALTSPKCLAVARRWEIVETWTSSGALPFLGVRKGEWLLAWWAAWRV